MPAIWEYSTLIRFLLIRSSLMKPHAAFESVLGEKPRTCYRDEFDRQKRMGTYPSGIFKEVSAKEMLMTNKPKYFKRNIENIVALAKYRGIDVVLTTFPYSPEFKDEPCVSSEEYISAFEEMNAILKDIARENSVGLFDFANLFKDKNYFVDGRHTTVEGTRVQAKLFADYIIESNIIPRDNSS